MQTQVGCGCSLAEWWRKATHFQSKHGLSESLICPVSSLPVKLHNKPLESFTHLQWWWWCVCVCVCVWVHTCVLCMSYVKAGGGWGGGVCVLERGDRDGGGLGGVWMWVWVWRDRVEILLIVSVPINALYVSHSMCVMFIFRVFFHK